MCTFQELQEIIQNILASTTINEYQSRMDRLNCTCDELYAEYDTKTNYSSDFYWILTTINGINDKFVDDLSNKLDNLEFNLSFQFSLTKPKHLKDVLRHAEDNYTTFQPLNNISLTKLRNHFTKSSRAEQRSLLQIFTDCDRSDFLMICNTANEPELGG